MSDAQPPLSVTAVVDLIQKVQGLLRRDLRAAGQAVPRDEEVVASLRAHLASAVADAQAALEAGPAELERLSRTYRELYEALSR